MSTASAKKVTAPPSATKPQQPPAPTNGSADLPPQEVPKADLPLKQRIIPPPPSKAAGIAALVEPHIFQVIRCWFSASNSQATDLAQTLSRAVEWTIEQNMKGNNRHPLAGGLPADVEDTLRAGISRYGIQFRPQRGDDAMTAVVALAVGCSLAGLTIKPK